MTSSIFLTPFIHVISPKFRYIFLSRYFASILMWWRTRGCPILDIKVSGTYTPLSFNRTDFFIRSKAFQSKKEPSSNETPTEWFSIIKSSREHTDEHIAKVVRALAQFSQLYGSTPSHSKVFEGVELEGVGYLDGNFFRRVAVLTLKRCLEGNHDDGSFGFGAGSHWYWDRL